jgi:hypothetical protein
VRPPLAAETIVAGMIRDRDVQELVLGDFAEEWRDRAEIDGPSDADRWYWRETMRTAPHLVRLWWRESPWHRIATVACIAMVARLVTLILGNAGVVLALVLAREAGMSVGPVAGLGMFALGFAITGAMIARVVRRAPLMVIVALLPLCIIVEAEQQPLHIVFESRLTFFLGTRLMALPALLLGALLVLRPRAARRVAQ